MNPMVLCYNLRSEQIARLRVLCLRLGIALRIVEREDFALPVGVLAGVAEKPETLEEIEPLFDPMLVMAHFRPGMLDAFLNELGRMGLNYQIVARHPLSTAPIEDFRKNSEVEKTNTSKEVD